MYHNEYKRWQSANFVVCSENVGQLGKILAVDGRDNVQRVKAGGWIWDEHWYSKIPEVNLDIKEIEKLI